MAALKDLASQAITRLSLGPHPDRARQDSETLLLHAIGKNRAWLIAHAEDELPEDQAACFLTRIERRQAGEPIQYILGETEFYGLPFRVTPDVLIPRPETEHLVEKTLELARNLCAPSIPRSLRNGWESEPTTALRILDVGTGSGAIAIALAHHLAHAQITAVDISPAALAIARDNAHRNSVSIRFLESNLLAAVSQDPDRAQFDIIVSNPPYVPTADRDSLSVEVRDHEPALALFAGKDGLDIYWRLIPVAYSALAPGGHLLLEIGYGQSEPIAALLEGIGFAQIEFVPDLQGIPRVACARRPF